MPGHTKYLYICWRRCNCLYKTALARARPKHEHTRNRKKFIIWMSFFSSCLGCGTPPLIRFSMQGKTMYIVQICMSVCVCARCVCALDVCALALHAAHESAGGTHDKLNARNLRWKTHASQTADDSQLKSSQLNFHVMRQRTEFRSHKSSYAATYIYAIYILHEYMRLYYICFSVCMLKKTAWEPYTIQWEHAVRCVVASSKTVHHSHPPPPNMSVRYYREKLWTQMVYVERKRIRKSE